MKQGPVQELKMQLKLFFILQANILSFGTHRFFENNVTLLGAEYPKKQCSLLREEEAQPESLLKKTLLLEAKLA